MSLAYCYQCLERIDEDNPDCRQHGDEIIYGEGRTNYLRGYRDAKDGKEENI